MSNEPAPAFQLLSTPLAKEQMRYLRVVADQTSSRESLYQTLKSIENALQTSPRDWGDPIRHLTGLKMVVYHRLYSQLVIACVVHEQESLVWLHSIEPGPGHLLIGDPNYPSR